MGKYIKREVFMENFCLCEFLDKVMKNRFPEKEVFCSKFVTEKMSGVVYSNEFSRNDAKMQVCMLKVTEIEEDKYYNLMLGINDKGEIVVNRNYDRLLSAKEIEKYVHNELEKNAKERAEKALEKASKFKMSKQENVSEKSDFNAKDSAEEKSSNAYLSM